MSKRPPAPHRWSGAGYVCIECGAIKDTPKGDAACPATCAHDFTDTCAPACRCERCWITYEEFKAMKPKEATPVMPPAAELSVSVPLDQYRELVKAAAAFDATPALVPLPQYVNVLKVAIASTNDALVLAVQFDCRATERAMRTRVDELTALLAKVTTS